MTISAIVIADSISSQGIRLTTFQLRYPRFIHAELMTHRTFSRNASSSRAIPVQKMIEDLRRDPAMPIYWGSNKPGMQAGEELTGLNLDSAKTFWLQAMNDAIEHADLMIGAGLHKQIANRILEPWAHINVVVTATDYENFFALRRHADAQPEIKALADAMWDAREANTPNLLQPGEWHLPYVGKNDLFVIGDYLRNFRKVAITEERVAEIAKKVSTARCGRVSYLTHDGRETTLKEDLDLYDRLVGSMPLHASPAEHQATPDQYNERDVMMARHGGWEPTQWEQPHLHGNLRGWIQNRKLLPGEFVEG